MNEKKHFFHLCLKQRYEIERMTKEGYTQTNIAKALGVDQSTISRELARNKSKRGYQHKKAQHLAQTRKKETKELKMTNKGC